MNFFSWIKKLRESRKWKKSDWLILILAGVLLLIIAMPTSGNGKNTKEKEEQQEEEAESEGMTDEEYAKKLTAELEEVLGSMYGVGKVKVMLTLEDDGEDVVNKDVVRESDTYSEETVLLDRDNDTVPYITSRRYPKVAGVVVVAEGAGTAGISTDITEMVMALFSIEAHKVKVVKMQ